MGKKLDEPESTFTVLATFNEVIALGAAVTTYQRQVAFAPEPRKVYQENARLLERFQRRLVQQIDHEEEPY
jgi:hypothetical protein